MYRTVGKCYKFDGLYYELIAYIGIGILPIKEEAMIHYLLLCTHSLIVHMVERPTE